ncbi:MAG TPA: tRNA (adenosine(37)-N6)-threonylcarbamoyltransferase complex ATPase subunit type 1 TsaE [Candidatus Scatovivens faecipullorum]|nr:tRNA (adenosine(37)-N6)-threonylcarbamoyltransferase complex ATPase subunit type 1 TsaE [Candidatus Scatovivens faecipullorum]
MEIISNSENETIELGKKIAQKLKKGDIIVLTGELGSGKTKLTEGILTYFGLQNEISSPTFTIVNEYDTNKFKIFHFDVYRLSDVDEFYAIGGEEYFEQGVSIIEWGEMIKEALPEKFINITFQRDLENENIRKIKIENLVLD